MRVASYNRRRAFAALTPLRAERLQHALTIAEVSSVSGVCTYRISLIERDLDDVTPEELSKLRAAITRLVEERQA